MMTDAADRETAAMIIGTFIQDKSYPDWIREGKADFDPIVVAVTNRAKAAADERQAAIVAWLRDKALTAPGEWGPIVASVMDGCADAIEAGEWKGQG